MKTTRKSKVHFLYNNKIYTNLGQFIEDRLEEQNSVFEFYNVPIKLETTTKINQEEVDKLNKFIEDWKAANSKFVTDIQYKVFASSVREFTEDSNLITYLQNLGFDLKELDKCVYRAQLAK